MIETKYVSSMIPSAIPTIPPVVVINFKQQIVLFCDIWKNGDGRTDENTCKINDHFPTEWINLLA